MLYQNISKYFFIPLSTKCNDELRENNFWSKGISGKNQIPSCFMPSSKRTSRNRSPRRATLRLRRHHEKQVNNALARVNNLTQSIRQKRSVVNSPPSGGPKPGFDQRRKQRRRVAGKIKAERAASGGKKPRVKILNHYFLAHLSGALFYYFTPIIIHANIFKSFQKLPILFYF